MAKLAKEGASMSKIGVILRDQYAVPSVELATGKGVKQILGAKGLRPELPEDLKNIIRMAVALYSHCDRNSMDFKSKRSLEVIEAKINKLVKYYKRVGVLAPDWRYDRERAALLVRA